MRNLCRRKGVHRRGVGSDVHFLAEKIAEVYDYTLGRGVLSTSQTCWADDYLTDINKCVLRQFESIC